MARLKSGGRWTWVTRPFSPSGGLPALTLLAFCALSAMATGMGFIDLRAANVGAGALSIGDILAGLLLAAFVVCAMVVALHNVVEPGRRIWVRAVALVFYLLFAVWSVGFGFGFFWKELAGREFTQTQFRSAIADLSGAMASVNDQLASAEAAILAAAELARTRAAEEAARGGTCANRPASTPGDGPLTRSRFVFADRAESLAAEARTAWTAPVAAGRARTDRRIHALDTRIPPAFVGVDRDEAELLTDLARVKSLSVARRQEVLERVFEDARGFTAEADRLRLLHAEVFADRLDDLARAVGPDPARPGAADPARADEAGYCWDVVLNAQLEEAAGRLREVAPVKAPDFEFLEGPNATRAAFFSMLGWIGGLFGLSVSGGVVPFGDKAFAALFASVIVDLAIFFLTILRAARPVDKTPPTARGEGEAPRPPNLSWIAES